MLKKLTFVIASVLVLGTASAALAQPQAAQTWRSYSCQTDEGYGRTLPCDGGTG